MRISGFCYGLVLLLAGCNVAQMQQNAIETRLDRSLMADYPADMVLRSRDAMQRFKDDSKPGWRVLLAVDADRFIAVQQVAPLETVLETALEDCARANRNKRCSLAAVEDWSDFRGMGAGDYESLLGRMRLQNPRIRYIDYCYELGVDLRPGADLSACNRLLEKPSFDFTTADVGRFAAMLGYMHQKAGYFEEAWRYYLTALENEGGHRILSGDFTYAGVVAAKYGELARLVAAPDRTKNPVAASNMVYAHAMAGNYGRAKSFLVNLHPRAAVENMAFVVWLMGDYPALGELRDLVQQEAPNAVATRLLQAVIALEEQQYEDAISFAQTAQTRARTGQLRVLASFVGMEAARRAQDFATARTFQQDLREHATVPTLRGMIFAAEGAMHHDAGEHAEAVQAFALALHLRPDLFLKGGDMVTRYIQPVYQGMADQVSAWKAQNNDRLDSLLQDYMRPTPNWEMTERFNNS